MTEDTIKALMLKSALKEAFGGSFFDICPFLAVWDAMIETKDHHRIYDPHWKIVASFHCRSWHHISEDDMVVLCYALFRTFGGAEADWNEAFVRSQLVNMVTPHDLTKAG